MRSPATGSISTEISIGTYAFILPTPSPSQTLSAIIPLFEAIAPILASRITSPQAPPWMDQHTEMYLRSLSDDDLADFERHPHVPPPLTTSTSPFLTHIHTLAKPLLSTFPYLANQRDDSSCSVSTAGRSRRRSKSRPRAGKRAQIRAVSSLLSDALARTSQPVSQIVDIGAGHAHLSAHLARELGHPARVVAVERDPKLLQTAALLHASSARSAAVLQGSLSFVEADALLQAKQFAIAQGDAFVGLHACGALGDAIVTDAVRHDVGAVLLVSCCLQKLAAGCMQREPVSAVVKGDASLRRHLTVARAVLGATNSARGYTRDGDLLARETRHAIRVLLADSGHEVMRIGDEVVGLSRHALRSGLRHVIGDIVRLHGIERPGDDQVEQRMIQASLDYRVMRALALPRAFSAAMLEMAVVLDRAACLEDAGFSVSTCRIWPDDVSARNLCCVAWR